MAAENERHIFKWKIENFSLCPHDPGKKLKSPEFSSELLAGIKWQLHLYPRGLDYESRNHVSCFLSKNSNDVESIEIEFNLIVLENGESCTCPRKSRKCIFKDIMDNGMIKFIVREELYEMSELFLPRDTLTVECTLRCVGSPPALPTHGSRIQRTFFPHAPDIDLSEREFVALDQDLMRKTLCLLMEWEARTIIEAQQMSVEYFGFINEQYVQIFVDNSDFPLLVLMKLERDKSTIRIVIYEGTKKSSAFAKCKLCVYGSNEGTLHEGQYEHFFSRSFKWVIDLDIDEVNVKYLTDPMRVKFNFQISVDHEGHSWIDAIKFKYWNALAPKRSPPSSGEDMLSMYTTQSLCDLTLVSAEAKELHAHKVVLGMRSPVFKAMLKNDKKEVQDNRIVVRDVDAKTLDQLLMYMYSLILPKIDYPDAVELYCAAEKFQVFELKEHCRKIMLLNLDLSLVYEVLCFSDIHKDNVLKNAAVEFAYQHSYEVFVSDMWFSLIETHPQLVAEVLRRVSSKASK